MFDYSRRRYEYFKSKGLSFKNFLEAHDVKNVAIYGKETINTEVCFNELQSCNVCVKFIIDKYKFGTRRWGTEVISPLEVDIINKVDMIIIANDPPFTIQKTLSGLYTVPIYPFIQIIHQSLIFEYNMVIASNLINEKVKKFVISHYHIDALKNIRTEDNVLIFVESLGIMRHNYNFYSDIFSDIDDYDDEYISEIMGLPKFREDSDGEIMLNDMRGKYLNVINGKRLTTDVPENYSKTIHILGPCMAYGYGAEDKNTIASFLQRLINERIGDSEYRVVNHGLMNHLVFEYNFKDVLSGIDFKENDIVVFFSWNNYYDYQKCNEDYIKRKLEGIDFTYIHSYEALNRECINQRLYTSRRHLSHNGNRLYANLIFDSIFCCSDIGFGKEDNLCVQKELINKDVSNSVKYRDTPDLALRPNNEELSKYLKYLESEKISANGRIGSIVMNCNPFTNGHKHLIQLASKEVDILYIFIVEEDKSLFPFEERLKLVNECVSELKNIKVLQSGKFIISSRTFPEYFFKDSNKNSTIDVSLDLKIFATFIAPILNISIRFVGREPICEITRQYNDSMKEILPKYNIEVKEFDRIKLKGEFISASKVRELLNMGMEGLDKIAELVPMETYKYLCSKIPKHRDLSDC